MQESSDADLRLLFPLRDSLIQGVVLTQNRLPVPGASVRVIQQSGRLDSILPSAHPPVTTDLGGRFTVDRLHSGEAQVEVRSDRFVTKKERVELDVEGISELELILEEKRGATFRVTRANDGSPVEGAVVRLKVYSGSSPREVEAKSGEDGIAIIDHVPAGNIELSSFSAQYGYSVSRSLVHDDLSNVVDIVLHRGEMRRGMVRDDRDWPVQVKVLQVQLLDEQGDGYAALQVSSNMAGNFVIDNVAPQSEIRISIFDDEFEYFDKSFLDPDPLLVQLRRRDWRAELRGRVVDANGNPIAGAMVSCVPAGGAPIPAVYSEDDGGFFVPQAPVGQVFFILTKEGSGSPMFGPIDVQEGANELGDLRLSTGSNVSVRVRRGGKPVESQGYCCLCNMDGFVLSTAWIRDGEARFEGVMDRSYLLSLHVPGCSGLQRTVVLQEGENVPIDLEVDPGLAVLAKLRFDAGVVESSPRVLIEVERPGSGVLKYKVIQDAQGGYSKLMSLPRELLEVRLWREGLAERRTFRLDLSGSWDHTGELEVDWFVP